MSLKDELLKAKLASKKQLKKVEHQQRVSRKQDDSTKNTDENKLEQKREKQQQKDRQLAQAQNEERQVKEKYAQIRGIIRKSKVYSQGGRTKFYFVAQNNKIPYVSVADDTSKSLESGQAAILEFALDNQEFIIVSGKTAKQVEKIEPELVRFFNR